MSYNKKNKHHHLHIISLCMYILIYFVSCGIKDIPLLESAGISVSSGVITIQHNPGNSTDVFVGYNVYYKFYAPEDITKIQSDRDYITDTNKTPNPNTITGRGFRKILPVTFNGISFSNDDVDDVLLKPVDKGSQVTYYLDFSAGTQVYAARNSLNLDTFISNRGYQAILIDGARTRILHRRQNNDVSNAFFDTTEKLFSETDDDIKSMITGAEKFVYGNELSIVIAVIPYGIDFEAVQRVYGDITMSVETRLDYTRTP